MNNSSLIKLFLRETRLYIKTEYVNIDFLSKIHGSEEFLICYELNEQESQKIDPNEGLFLGSLVFFGERDNERDLSIDVINSSRREQVSLPKGDYVFVQQRSDKALSQPEWLKMAIELQKDGLWERHKLGNMLYIRFLYEDGAIVTQIFRQCR